VQDKDAACITGIYNYYIEHSTVTFEEEKLSVDAMGERITHIRAQCPYLVWDEGGVVRGYAYVHPYHTRSAYRFTCEDTVYVQQGYERQGIGRALMEALLGATKKQGFHAVIACITMPNQGSVGLHEDLGFAPLGIFREVGYKNSQWLNVGYWELLC
jgi:phosphinothricin acetyltransferase